MAEADSYLDGDSQPPITSSMVTITHRRPDHLSVFPPINHEGLHVSSPSHSSSSSSSTSITADSDESEGLEDALPHRRLAAGPPHQDCVHLKPEPSPHPLTRVPSSLCGWLGFGLEILLRRIRISAPSIPGQSALVGAFRSFPLLTTAAAVYVASLVISWLRLRVRHRRKHEVDMLVRGIRDRDEKILKLLDQIALLNEVLLGHQRSQ
uniref:Transmembrane protein n=1 Tax=Kalanchoe fedtschenkoi TaxID=63787 RepID=A0A7N0TWQ4_KALFE